ncbi:SDR family NAD(P)-dependent oxidoreductase [Parahaliea sp. F7430]|uniref:SDR family NAD(P)-dependent oxidoreductase n=1 Tax=Sediminihaliea albiluteola TaxID=2758564 RepID=A0A7W2YJ59_9GAMM|nr:SDR family NAD(P)-dependent oxidoreductase [Sediminihaliea albiluteola]MBA6412762.1 SDR family NAD(P)-dependent oxidoreductase [Sediminihaliea albiluteola]
MSKTIALVTGASSGLGEQFCRALAGRCDRIIAVARRAERLTALAEELSAEVELVPVVADLATLEGVARTVEALRQKGPVTILINNAGFSTFGAFAESNIEQEHKMMRVHMDAAVSLCRAALPFMREQQRGYVINVSSVGSFLPLKLSAVYGACKAFLNSFSISLQEEEAANGIRVQCLCPGLTRTEIHDTESFAGFDKSLMPEEMWMEPADVVDASLAALDSEQVFLVPGAINQSLVRQGLEGQLQSIAE